MYIHLHFIKFAIIISTEFKDFLRVYCIEKL